MTLKRLTLVALVAGVFGAAVSARASAAPKPAIVPVVISQVAFTTPELKVKVGDIVEWENKDVIDHTSTSKAGKWDVTIPAGKKTRATMKTAGTFDYYCRFHPNMTARIAVVK